MKRILVVDDDKEAQALFSEMLAAQGHSLQFAVDADGALHRIKAWKPHLILLSTRVPSANGAGLITRLRESTSGDYVPVVLLSTDVDVATVSRGLDAGADDYLAKPFRAHELVVRIRMMLKIKEIHDALKRANHRIEELSTADDLTGVMNSRALLRRGEEEINRCKRFRKPISGIWVNVDNFSDVNHSCGFGFGSSVLRELAQKIRQTVRTVDYVGRIGGDEFFILLTEGDLASAEEVAERIRSNIESTVFRNEKQSARMTVSIGIAGITPNQSEQRHQGSSLSNISGEGGAPGMGTGAPSQNGAQFGAMNDLLQAASEALRTAKANGPNRIEIYSFV